MKKVLFLALGLITALASICQTTTTTDRAVIRQSLYLKNAWLDSVKTDTSFKLQSRAIPTAKLVHDHVTGRLITLVPDSLKVLNADGTNAILVDNGKTVLSIPYQLHNGDTVVPNVTSSQQHRQLGAALLVSQNTGLNRATGSPLIQGNSRILVDTFHNKWQADVRGYTTRPNNIIGAFAPTVSGVKTFTFAPKIPNQTFVMTEMGQNVTFGAMQAYSGFGGPAGTRLMFNRGSISNAQSSWQNMSSYIDFNNTSPYPLGGMRYGGAWNLYSATAQVNRADTMDVLRFFAGGDIHAVGTLAPGTGIFNGYGAWIQDMTAHGIFTRPFAFYNAGAGDKNVFMGSTLIGDSVLTNFTTEKLYVKGGVKINNSGNNIDFVNGVTHRFSGTTGNVMIGTSTDDAVNRFQVSGTANVTTGIGIGVTDYNTYLAGASKGISIYTNTGGAIGLASSQGFNTIYTNASGHLKFYNDLGGNLYTMSNGTFKHEWTGNSKITVAGNAVGLTLEGDNVGVKFRNTTDADQYTVGTNVSGVNPQTLEVFSHTNAAPVMKIKHDRISFAKVLNLTPVTPPTSTADSSGSDGDTMIGTDGNLYYKKAGTGWIKFTGTTFTP